MSTPNYYPGTYKSAIARAKKILIAAGFPWSTTTGRYTPYFNEQKTTRGMRVTRVGYSATVSCSVWGDSWGPTEESRMMQALAIATLREAGLPFADNGFLECNPAGVY